MSTTYQQPVLPIVDPQAFAVVRNAIEFSFSNGQVIRFLESLGNSSLRVRHFEDVLSKGLLGSEAGRAYAKLGDSDQGQIREFYLATLEAVSPQLRMRFFKLYAYY